MNDNNDNPVKISLPESANMINCLFSFFLFIFKERGTSIISKNDSMSKLQQATYHVL